MNTNHHGTSTCNSIYLEFEINGLCLCCNDNENFHEESEYQTTQGVLEEYRHADRKRRCDIWLMFRDLREKFDDMERVQPKKCDSKALTWFRLI